MNHREWMVTHLSQPAALLGRVPIALMLTDHEGRISHWGAAAERMFGYRAEEVLGRRGPELFPPELRAEVAALRDRLFAGEYVHAVFPMRCRDGGWRLTDIRAFPIRGPAGRPGIAALFSDAEDLEEVETELAFTQGLLREAPFGLVLLDEELRYVHLNQALADINRVPLEDHLGRWVWDIMQTEASAEYERAIRSVLQTGEPIQELLLSGRTPGHRHQDRVWSANFFRMSAADGTVLGVGGFILDVTEQRAARLEASAARQRLELIDEASARIGSTLDITRTAAEVTEVMVPAFADCAVVEVLDRFFEETPSAGDPRSRRLAGHTSLPTAAAQQLVGTELAAVFTHPPYSAVYDAVRSGRPALHLEVEERLPAQNDRHARLARDAGLRSVIFAPLIARGQVLGVAFFGRDGHREPFTPEDVKLAEEVANRAAVCLDNARLYSRERETALRLQRSLLPQEIPPLTGLEITYRYLPGSEGAEVGGDWFDVIPLSGDRVALVAGDVMGHGVRAAATMGQLRMAVRTLATLDMLPDDVLSRLDDVVQNLSEIPYATCIYAVYDPVARRCCVANAGHPPPVLRYPDGGAAPVDLPRGVPLGVGGVSYQATEIELPEGATLVLYTDGLIEQRGQDIEAGIERLCRVLDARGGALEQVADDVISALHRGNVDDDVAMLIARVIALPSDRVRTWQFLPETTAPGRARRLIRETLCFWDLSQLTDTAQLLATELVTNALWYAYGPIELRLIYDRALLCEVVDGDTRSPRQRQADSDDEDGRGLELVSKLAHRWGSRPLANGKVVWFELALPG
ncbi:SpoIIE family protein phosphatase [Carbonactinospora thermoautotrophica]|uniref:SpoIIE family protein phosphatase n=1 Tax=Carbonactinospora thermoautotrophica TaxID=1469144 RepID=UPI00226DFCF8|nr:SpoIIE family protein phosphatase [Carbonactinospora thermoautotrophica]